MRLVTWAKKHHLTYRAAWEYFKKGDLPKAYKLPSGTIIVPNDLDELLFEAYKRREDA